MPAVSWRCEKENASTKSVQEFRDAVVASLKVGSGVLLNTIDALMAGSRSGSPVELTLSSLFAYDWKSLSRTVRRAEKQLADTIEEDDWLGQLRAAQLNWLKDHPPDSQRKEPGAWRARILDASNYKLPKAPTVEVGHVHGADGMKPGHGLSLLNERKEDGKTRHKRPLWLVLAPDAAPVRSDLRQTIQHRTQHPILKGELGATSG